MFERVNSKCAHQVRLPLMVFAEREWSEAELQLKRSNRANGGRRPCLGLPETLDAVGDLRSLVTLVRELRHREREGL